MDFYSEVLIVTGGAAIGGMNRSVELLNMDGSHICNLPALPNSWVDRERAGKADFFMDHTQTGLVTCGGGGFHNGRQKYCVTFNPDEGSWQETHILQKTREFHSSWASPQGVMLLGGTAFEPCRAYTTTEILTNNGDTKPGFQLKYETM